MFDTSLDTSNFYQVIKDFPQQFTKVNSFVGDTKVDGDFKRVIICGLGGSAMPYDLLKAYLADKGIDLSLEITRTYTLPKTANENDLIIVSSYSGNTEEVISCLEEAHAKNLTIVGFSRAGKIEELSKEYGFTYIQYPEEGETFQPRNAIGYSFTAMAFFLMNSGIIPGNKQEILDLAAFLEGLDVEEEAKQLAQGLGDKIPLIYTSDEYQNTVARIVKIKFNENAKMSAFYNSFPELNHNEMVGFTLHASRYHMIYFKDADAHERVNKRMDIMKGLIEEKGGMVTVVHMQGASFLEKMFAAIIFGDYLTYYKSLLNGIDPTPVDMVEDFKKMLVA
jgi:glucose/mannose-6-phosphate isomerase